MTSRRQRLPVGFLQNTYSSQNVGTSPVQLSALMPVDVNLLHVFDTGANIANVAIVLLIGPAGSETEIARFSPGCDHDYSCILNKGMRVSIAMAAGANVTTGELLINLFQ